MKRQNLLKLAFTMLAVMMFTGAMAQTYKATIATDYENVAETIYQTVGLGMRLYVHPDPAYSPNFVAAETVNPTSEWRWEYGGTAWGTGTTQLKDWTAAQNYVDLTPSTGIGATANTSVVVRVLERYGASGCEPAGATHKTKTIKGVAVPSADIEVNTFSVAANWTDLNSDGLTYTTCSSTPGTVTLNVNFTELGNDVTAYQNYTFGLTKTVTTYEASGAIATGPTANATYVEKNIAQTLTGVTDALVMTHTTAGGSIDLAVSGKRTVYEFELTASSIGSFVSRISNYRSTGNDATYPWYTGATTKLTFIINLPPVTGPIYHIPNSFSGF
jgi:hypothetical protein